MIKLNASFGTRAPQTETTETPDFELSRYSKNIYITTCLSRKGKIFQ